MHKQLSTWQFIQHNLRQNIAVMLLYVIESKGSSPGRQGFLMSVNINGGMSGSLGGGIMEHKFAELAKSRLANITDGPFLYQQLHDKVAAKNQSGMICSGEQTIFTYTLKTGDAATIDQLIQSLENNGNGTLQLSDNGVFFLKATPVQDYQLQTFAENHFLYQEKTGYKNELYIIGGGHCSLALSQIMGLMDFYIHVFDDRRNLNTLEQNHFVQEKKVVETYENINDFISGGSNKYIVIMTFGYRTDEVILKAVINKPFRYLGVLGSKSKMDKMFSGLLSDGFLKQLPDGLHAPIGMPIKSKTPEEIAISIAAEIIKVKNKYLP